MLEAIGAAPGSHTDVDWHDAWRNSPEFAEVQRELNQLKVNGENAQVDHADDDKREYDEFAAPLWSQLLIVTRRVFEQYWRTPSYIYSKFALCLGVSLFIGLVFLNAPLSIQGLQNQMFAIFNILTIFGQLVQQQMPHFVVQRSLYEVRERPSKTYSWKVFMLSQILVEIPWNTLMSLVMFLCTYYPVGFSSNASNAGQGSERSALMWLLFWQFLIFTCTFAHACIALVETAEAGGNMANVLFNMCLLFCGVLAGPSTLPKFWIFMYRVSPFTYWVSAVMSTGLANADVTCNSNELVTVIPPNSTTCIDYLSDYMSQAGGYLVNDNARDECQFCPLANTNAFLEQINSDYSKRWRDFGIGMAFIAFNIAAAVFFYWLARMPKGKKGKKKQA
jgi:ATP-binding cassette subfamily G (WHITE) protein 2 (PDR)